MRMFAALVALAGCGRFGFGSSEGTTWQGIAYEVSGVIPAGIPAEVLHIAANGVDVTLDYFVRISTP